MCYGGISASVEHRHAGILDDLLLPDEAAKIRLVDVEPCDRLDAALELQKREDRRHQLEDDGIVFELGPYARDACRKNATVGADHRVAKRRPAAIASPPPRLLHDPRLLAKLIALQN